jgi:hypothetical protein
MALLSKKFLMFLLALLAMLYLLNFFANNSYTQDFLRTLVFKTIQEHTNMSLDYELSTAKIFPPEVDVYGVKLSMNASKAVRPFLEIAHISLKISMWSILFGEFKIIYY